DYVGPYKLKGADYAGQPWLREAEIKGRYISNAFLGLRGFPHMVIAVHRLEENGGSWTLRVTIDTSRLEQLVSAVGPNRTRTSFSATARASCRPVPACTARLWTNCPFNCPRPATRPWCGA
ncbi:MAG: two-component sensor histidine kinase, partial [Desulfovibrio fairfieldensis]|nr:two-component sensor histidine kinase [Desulfovibrio fairfieldensis]